MLTAINLIIAAIGLAAALLTIISFFGERLRHKILLLAATLICSAALVGFSITDWERAAASTAIFFYSCLPREVRLRHLPFLENVGIPCDALISAFRSGGAEYWNGRAVDDLTR